MAHLDNPEAVDAPVTYDEQSAAAALNDIFGSEEEQDLTPEGEPDADLELDGEEEQADDTDEPETAIDPPVSLNAEEKAKFAQLPGEAQQLILDVEARRNAQVQEATTKAAAREREATMATQQAEAAADARRATQLKAFADAFRPVMPDPQLAQRDPASYIALEAQYRAEVAQFAEIEQQIEALGKGAMEQLEQVDLEARKQDLSLVPKLADPATRDDYLKSSFELVSELGLDPRSFEMSAGSDDFKALEKVADWKSKAERFDKAMARQMQKVRASKGKTLRPNATQSNDSGRSRAFSESTQRLQRTGSVDDAAAAIRAML